MKYIYGSLAAAIFLTICLVAAPLCALAVDGALTSPATLYAVQKRLAEKAAAIESIQADFVQKKHLSIFSEAITSKGHFSFERPDNLRWEMTEPVSTGFVLSGNTGRRWHELQEGEEEFNLRRNPVMGSVADQLISWASADFSRLEKTYRIELTVVAPAAFRLIPKANVLSRYLEAIDVIFAEDETHVKRVTVREKGGDYTEMLFDNVRLNAPLPKEVR